MPLLNDLRLAYLHYVHEHVKLSISPVRPAVPGTVNPNEEFSFDVTMQNDSLAANGMPIVNIRILLYIDTGGGQLIVPALRIIKEVRSDRSVDSVLSPGQLVKHMIISPSDDNLGPGQQLTLTGLRGKAGSAVETILLKCYLTAAVDMDWVFPKDPPGLATSISVDVV